MSALKYQLKELLPSLVAEAQRNKDPEVKRRLYLIKAVVDSPKEIAKVCESRGVSRESFYKWAKKLLAAKSLSALKSQSRRPKRSPKLSTRRVVRAVRKIKKKYSFMGPERISFNLRNDKGLTCPPSTVYGILKREGLIAKKYRERRSKKHLKRYRRPTVGYLQLDIKYVPYRIDGAQFYQWSVVDHHSSWRLIRCYKNKALTSLARFLEELEDLCPFTIIQLQTDNDIVFTDKFWTYDFKPSGCHDLDEWCLRKGIEHKLIPPGMKELNGKVENTHKYDDEEFYSQHDIINFNQLERLTIDYNHLWNHQRATKTLGWQTPIKVVQQAQWQAIAYLIWLKLKYPEPKSSQRVIYNNQGKIYFQTDSAEETEHTLQPETKYQNLDLELKTVEGSKKASTKKTAVERYLQWLEWDEKNNRCLILVSPMSQIFPRSAF